MTTIDILNQSAIESLRRDHARLEQQVRNLERQLSSSSSVAITHAPLLAQATEVLPISGDANEATRWIGTFKVMSGTPDTELEFYQIEAYDWFQTGVAVDDKVYLWRNPLTGMLCFAITGPRILKAVADSSITYDSSGTVSIWKAGADSGVNVTAYLNWMHGDENISSGKELLIQWFPDEEKWVIIGADCE